MWTPPFKTPPVAPPTPAQPAPTMPSVVPSRPQPSMSGQSFLDPMYQAHEAIRQATQTPDHREPIPNPIGMPGQAPMTAEETITIDPPIPVLPILPAFVCYNMNSYQPSNHLEATMMCSHLGQILRLCHCTSLRHLTTNAFYDKTLPTRSRHRSWRR